MTMTRFLWTTLAALGCVAAAIGFQAIAQDGPGPAGRTPTVVEAREDGTLVELTLDGKIVQTAQGQPSTSAANPFQPRVRYETVDERLPDGPVHRRTVQVPYNPYGSKGPHGLSSPPDAESQKLLEQEQAAAQDVRTLASGAIGPDAEVKKRLREKLAQIFDLQQQRRTHEIAKIEERLGKLKETLKKREAAKDSIVDRRVETLTGGVDELGWEETFPGGQGIPNAAAYIPSLPAPVPVPPGSGRFPPTTSVPPPVGPGPGADLPAAYPPAAPRAPTPAPAAGTAPAADPAPAALPAPSLTPPPAR